MRQFIAGITLSGAANLALAAPMFLLSGGSGSVNLTGGFSATAAQLGISVPSSVSIANLEVVGEPALVTYTFIGSEAGFVNKLLAGTAAPATTEVFSTSGVTAGIFTVCPGACVSPSFAVEAGTLPFLFRSITPTVTTNLANGANQLSTPGPNNPNAPNFGVFLADPSTAYLFYADNRFSDHDDMIIKVSISPVPEPSTYAMLLAGLGVMGMVIRRRRRV